MMENDDVRRTEISVVTNDQALPGTLDTIFVSYSDRINRPKATRIPLGSIVEQIRSSTDLAEKTAAIRILPTQDERQRVKADTLPWFSMSEFKGNYRDNDSFLSTKFVVLDTDNIPDRIANLKEDVKSDPYVFVAFVSPSGTGMKLIFELERMVTSVKEFEAVFQDRRRYVEEKFGVRADDDEDPSHACYLSSDPDIYVNPTAREVRVPRVDPVVMTPTRMTGTDDILSAFKGSTSPGRTNALTRVVGHLNRAGIRQDIALWLCKSWNSKMNTPPLDDDKVEYTVRDVYERYEDQARATAIRFQEVGNCYYKVSGNGTSISQKLTATFTITSRELLVLPDGDCLKCDVTSAQGHTYPGILIENCDWLSKSKLLSAIGHSDCTFLGSDTDVQALCSHVIRQVPVRKLGTKMIGLHGDLWAIEDMNITASGVQKELQVVPFDKGADTFYRGITYETFTDEEYTDFVRAFYDNILSINEPHVILPWLAWTYVVPVKERLRTRLSGFPLMFVHGGQGSGKTSTGTLLMRLCGYKNPIPYSCTMRTFPLLKTLTSTNGIPVVLDEFKKSDMKEDEADSVLRIMRRSYSGEIETKGHADQTVENYELLAPLVVMGEWDIAQPATKERVLVARFTGEVKKNASMQKAFARVGELPLESFMPRYIQFILNQDVGAILEWARALLVEYFRGKQIAPRVLDNLSVMMSGLELFIRYGQHHGAPVPGIDYTGVIRGQIAEITGTGNGFVRSAVDQLIHELGIMWAKKYKSISPSYIEDKWWDVKELSVGEKREKRKVIAIHFERAFPEFKEYARRTSYEGDLLDGASYKRLFSETDYITDVSRAVGLQGKTYKCVCVDVDLAEKAGVDLVGFVTADYQEITESGNESESEKE